jgi:hypothetical protein
VHVGRPDAGEEDGADRDRDDGATTTSIARPAEPVEQTRSRRAMRRLVRGGVLGQEREVERLGGHGLPPGVGLTPSYRPFTRSA